MHDTPGHDIVVIGASLGGVAALRTLVAALPGDLPAAVFIVLHTDPRSPGLLAGILQQVAHMPVAMAIDGEPIVVGQVRVARPDHHLLLELDRVRVLHGPKENRSRPAVDTLFRSAATVYGSRVVGVVLTGRLDDGSAGLWAIKRAGGICVVQDPQDAECSEMPANARAAVDIDHCCPLADLPQLLTRLTRMPASEKTMPPNADHEVPGIVYVCPDCDGPLREIKVGNEKLVRFRCLVGHAFSMRSLIEAHAEAREAALWSAVVALEHEAMLADRAAQHGQITGDLPSAEALKAEAAVARAQSVVVRELLQARASKAS